MDEPRETSSPRRRSGRVAWLLLAAFALVATLYGARAYSDRQYEEANTREWSQRLTVEIQTPFGVRSGSSVTRIFWKPIRNTSIFAQNSWGRIWTQKGDGFAIDIGNKDYLFISTRGVSGSAKMAEMYFSVANPVIEILSGGVRMAPTLPQFKGLNTPDSISTFIRGGSWPLSIMQVPAAYRFRDRNDPLSIERIKLDDLEGAYGPGYSFRSARIDIVEQPATCNSMDALLPWIRRDFKGALDGSRYGGETVASNVHTGFFFTPGDCK